MLFCGLQSLLFYTTMTWLPTMATQAGISQANAGILASVFTLMSLPFSMTIPSLTTSFLTKPSHHADNDCFSWFYWNCHAVTENRQLHLLVDPEYLDRKFYEYLIPLPHGYLLHEV